MKKFLAVALAVVFSFSFCLVGFADSLVTEKPVISNSSVSISMADVKSVLNVISTITDKLQAKCYATREYYFYYMLMNKLNYSVTEFTVDTNGNITGFTNDYLFYYLKYGVVKSESTSWYNMGHGFKDTGDGRTYMSLCGFDCDWDWYYMGFQYTANITTVSSYDDYLNSMSSLEKASSCYFEFFDYYNTALAKIILSYNLQSLTLDYASNNLTDYSPVVSGSVLNEYIEEQNTLSDPKGKDLFLQSYRTATYWHKTYASWETPIFDDTKNTPLSDLYLVPFYLDNDGTYYYSDIQLHFYYVEEDDPNADRALYCDVYKWVSDLGYVLQKSVCCFELLSYALPDVYYMETGLYKSSYCFLYYGSFEQYSNGKSTGSTVIDFSEYYYFSADRSSSVYVNDSNFSNKFYKAYSDHISGDTDDLGYICSKSSIERTYSDIDTSQINNNYVVTITGDTVYDYSITNPETGESDTINNYVTNNYTYVTNNTTNNNGGDSSGGSGGSSGGSVSGDVTVHGDIGVNGNVGVDINVNVPDININVNQVSGAGSSGTGINPDDILNGSSVDLEKYYDDAVSQASGVRSFLTLFFDFLPVEIISLLGMLIAVAIVCRIFGR